MRIHSKTTFPKKEIFGFSEDTNKEIGISNDFLPLQIDALAKNNDLPEKKKFSWNKTGLFLIRGRKGFTLSHLVSSQLAREGFLIYIVDCAIRFDIFKIVEMLESLNEDIEDLLTKFIIQRAFTPYQILDSTFQVQQREKFKSIYIYLAPFKQFFDGDVKQKEAEFLLKKLITRFVSIKNLGLPLIIVEKEKYSSPIFPEAMSNLRSIATRELDLVSTPLLSEADLFGNI